MPESSRTDPPPRQLVWLRWLDDDCRLLRLPPWLGAKHVENRLRRRLAPHEVERAERAREAHAPERPPPLWTRTGIRYDRPYDPLDQAKGAGDLIGALFRNLRT